MNTRFDVFVPRGPHAVVRKLTEYEVNPNAFLKDNVAGAVLTDYAEVLAVGELPDIRAGQIVYLRSYSGNEMNINRQDCLLVHDVEITGIASSSEDTPNA